MSYIIISFFVIPELAKSARAPLRSFIGNPDVDSSLRWNDGRCGAIA